MKTICPPTSIYNNQMEPHAPIYSKVMFTNAKKRMRDSVLGEDVWSQMYRHAHDVDLLILQHTNNARIELSEKRKQFSSKLISAANEMLSERLKSKDHEIERLKSVNGVLEEHIKRMCVENSEWKYLAQTNEATGIALKAKLEQVLVDQARMEVKSTEEEYASEEDAESCCVGDNYDLSWPKRSCRSCGGGEPSVLLLPCRHLCLCAVCGPRIHTCPVCKYDKNGSINVNLC